MSDILSSIKTSSGIDIPKLAADLAAAEVAPRKDLATAQRTSADNAVSGLAVLRATLAKGRENLAEVIGRTDVGWQAVSSAPDSIKVSFTGAAAPSAFRADVEVLALAREQLSVSGPIAPAGGPVGTGVITIRFGSRASGSFVPGADEVPIDVPITAGNSSLAGIAAALRAAEPRLQASVVTTTLGERLSLRGPTGDDRAFEFSVADDSGVTDGSAGLSRLTAGPTAVVLTQAASAARVRVDGAEITARGNLLDGVLPGLSLDLSRASIGQTATIETSLAPGQLADGVQALVDQINELGTSLRELSARGLNGQAGGPLAGDPAARQMLSELRRLTTLPLTAPDGTALTLAELGVRTNRDGSLMIDQTILEQAIAADPARVAAAFHTGIGGTALGITPLRAGRAAPGSYAITALSAPTAGRLVGSVDLNTLGWPLTLHPGDTGLRLAVDGVQSAAGLAVEPGSYATPAALALAIAQAAGNDPVLRAAGAQVTATVAADGRLQLVSGSVGQASVVSLVSVAPGLDAALGLAAGTATPGAAPSGQINGTSALASGGALRGAIGTAAEGLSFAVGAFPQDSTLVVTRGIFDRLSDLLVAAGAKDSSISNREQFWQRQATAAAARLETLDTELERLEERYRLSFGQMESLVSSLNSTGDFLTNQMKMWTSDS